MPQDCGKAVTLLRSWPHNEIQMWELIVPRNAGENSEKWMSRLAGIIKNLGGHAWCVNTHDLVRNFQMPLDSALQEWGRHFWPRFKHNSVFYFTAGNDAGLIRQNFLKWHKKETNVCFRERYDLVE